jgi:hypothetical protein
MHSLRKDTGGAIMVMAVFMAMIAIGALYYLVGLGDAILAQERMQDAADASAFSAAVIHARGMNLLALINIMMAALLAILVMLSMLASLFSAAVVVLAAISWLVPAAAGLIPPTNTAAKGFSQAEQRLQKPIHKTIQALHKLQGPLNKAVPALASMNAAKLSRLSYGDVVDVGVTFPIFDGLPTREGKFETLCEKAGEYAGTAAVMPIEFAIGKNFLTRKLKKMTKGLGKKYARFYCGKGPKPKAPSFEEDVSIPEMASVEQRSCEINRDQDACDRYQKQVEALQDAYDTTTGTCTGTTEIKGLCNKMRRQARRDCNPQNTNEFIKDYTWEEYRYTRHFVLEGEGENQRVVETPRSGENYRQRKAKGIITPFAENATPVPCKTGIRNGNMTRWDESRPPDEPLCETDFKEPDVDFFKITNRTTFDIDILEVVDVLRCTVEREIKTELKGEPMDDTLKEKMKPQEMCSCAALGEETFQVRSIVLGDPKEYTADADKTILVATQGQEVAQSSVGRLVSLGGRVAAAQAEFYYDGTEVKAEWLWNMKWKARMRRLTMNRKGYECPVRDTCNTKQLSNGSNLSSDMARKLGSFRCLLEGADSIIVH